MVPFHIFANYLWWSIVLLWCCPGNFSSVIWEWRLAGWIYFCLILIWGCEPWGIQFNLEKFACLENALRAKEILVFCFALWALLPLIFWSKFFISFFVSRGAGVKNAFWIYFRSRILWKYLTRIPLIQNSFGEGVEFTVNLLSVSVWEPPNLCFSLLLKS